MRPRFPVQEPTGRKLTTPELFCTVVAAMDRRWEDVLQDMGYTNVFSKAGGWKAWKESPAPIE